ncbi:hypothetical protein D3C86_1874990 [compost metagenome]
MTSGESKYVSDGTPPLVHVSSEYGSAPKYSGRMSRSAQVKSTPYWVMAISSDTTVICLASSTILSNVQDLSS